jgi:hypothetical protein
MPVDIRPWRESDGHLDFLKRFGAQNEHGMAATRRERFTQNRCSIGEEPGSTVGEE